MILDHCSAGGRAANGAPHLGFDVTVAAVVGGDTRIDDAARGGAGAVADEEEINKCTGSIKSSRPCDIMTLDLLAPSTSLVGAAFEHIGALGGGAYDFFGGYIPEGLVKNGDTARPLVCSEDPDELKRVLLQAQKQQVLQRVSVVLQRGNVRMIRMMADGIAPQRRRRNVPPGRARRRARVVEVARSGGGINNA